MSRHTYKSKDKDVKITSGSSTKQTKATAALSDARLTSKQAMQLYEMANHAKSDNSDQAIQRAGALEEEEPMQGKFETAQLAAPEEEEPLQGKFETSQLAAPEEEEPLQGKLETSQFAAPEEEELMQGKFETSQLTSPEEEEPMQGKFTAQRVENKTGMPDNLKAGIENLSGHNLDHVRVHYNSSKPAAVQAHAYAQGSDIHLASGQDKHLPHEAWHVVQQMEGRVQPTTDVNGMSVNDDPGLEKEADNMGAKALKG